MTQRWGRPASGTWWAEEGSNKPVKDEEYLHNVVNYVWKQRTV